MATEHPRSSQSERTNPYARSKHETAAQHRARLDRGKQEISRRYANGQISDADYEELYALLDPAVPKSDEQRSFFDLPKRGSPRPPAARPRASRPAPAESRQYANPTSTTASRDDRLTPNAKALLQVIRARCGKGTETRTTKGTLAAVIARSKRTICRYLRDLERCGYIETETRMDHRGYHLGLSIRITSRVMPFWSDIKQLGRWLGEIATSSAITPYAPFAATTRAGQDRPFHQGVTLLSSKNQTDKDSHARDKNGWGVLAGGAGIVP